MKLIGEEFVSQANGREGLFCKFLANQSGIVFFSGRQEHRTVKLDGISYEEEYKGNAMAGVVLPGRLEIRFHSGFSELQVSVIMSKALSMPSLYSLRYCELYYAGKKLPFTITESADENDEGIEAAHFREVPSARRIIVIESAEDSIAEARIRRLRSSSALRDYSITVVHAVVAADMPAQHEKSFAFTCAWADEFPMESIEDKLQTRLLTEIRRVEPGILLLMAGFVFKQYSDQVCSILRFLHDQHAEIRIGRFGAKKGMVDIAPLELFDRGGKVLGLERTISDILFKR